MMKNFNCRVYCVCFSKQGAQVRSLRMDAEENRLKLEIQLADVAAAQVAKLLAKQVAVESVATMA